MMAALSVGTGMFAMAITNTEHPPAAGTALGLVIHGWSWSAVVFILSSALALSLMRLALRPRLINLLKTIGSRVDPHGLPWSCGPGTDEFMR